MAAKGIVVTELDKTIESGSAQDFNAWVDTLVASPTPTPVLTETGIVTEVGDGVAMKPCAAPVKWSVCLWVRPCSDEWWMRWGGHATYLGQ